MWLSNRKIWTLTCLIILFGTSMLVFLKFHREEGSVKANVETPITDVSGSVTAILDPCAKPRRKTGVEDLLCMEPPKFLKGYKNPCWIQHGSFRCLPYFHLIGHAKCGTTDFFKRLCLHPDILPNKGFYQKETFYWSWNRLRPRKQNDKLLTFEDFTDFFPSQEIRNNETEDGYHYKITGHGDPMDFYDRLGEENIPQNTPGEEELQWTAPYVIKHINPDVKLLLILRDPIERLYSHYFHGRYGTSATSFHNHTVQSISVLNDCLKMHSIRHCIFSKAVVEKMKIPLHGSFEIVHLKEWLKVFPRKQFFIFRNEDFTKDVGGHLIQVFKFLNVSIPTDKVLQQMSSMPHYRQTESKHEAGPMLPETRNLLKNLLQPYVNALADCLQDNRYLFRDTNFT